jgi:predicted O-methyltransferase YrrM
MIFNYSNKDSLNHLDLYKTYVHGPIQKDEAMFLYSIVKMIRPSTILEFGLQFGLSAYNFALAKDCESFYFGLDKKKYCVNNAKELCKNIKNCFFIESDCLDFSPDFLSNRKVDLFFLDCPHDFEINKKCLKKIIPILSDDGVIIIHDTGYYTLNGFEKSPESYKKKHKILGENIKKFGKVAVINAEQKTVNWFVDEYKEFSFMHFHSDKIMRNGMTLMQKSKKLI